jgi:hypothetical protein
MDDLTAAIQEFSATVGAVKSTVDNSEAILMDMVAWKPHMDGAMSEMCADINVLRQQLGRVAPHPVLTMDPDLLRERAAPSSLDGAGGEMAFGDSGRGPAGHRGSTQPRGVVVGEQSRSSDASGHGYVLQTRPHSAEFQFVWCAVPWGPCFVGLFCVVAEDGFPEI